MYGAHACLVPVNYFVASIFEYLQIHGKTHSSIRAADLRHLLLLLPFVLDNLLKDEVDKYNRDKAQGSDVLVDPSEELVMVANTFVSWYRLFRSTNPPKTPRDVQTLTTQADRLLGMFSTVFPYKKPIHSPSQPRGMTKQYAHTARAPALSLPTRGGGSDLQS